MNGCFDSVAAKKVKRHFSPKHRETARFLWFAGVFSLRAGAAMASCKAAERPCLMFWSSAETAGRALLSADLAAKLSGDWVSRAHFFSE